MRRMDDCKDNRIVDQLRKIQHAINLAYIRYEEAVRSTRIDVMNKDNASLAKMNKNAYKNK